MTQPERMPARALDDAPSITQEPGETTVNTNALMIRSPRGRYMAADRDTILRAAAAYHAEALAKRGPLLQSPRDTRAHLVPMLAGRESEVFCMLTLDNRNRVIRWHELFRGTIDGASVHPREVVKTALADNAAAVILAHNHPSGNAEPSHADERITARLRDALALVDIRLLDHIVVAGDQTTSLAERGQL